jgi:hypothetical protein
MISKNDRPQLERPATAGQPAPKKRFRIMKLEERIAPKRGGNTKNCSHSDYSTMAC